MTTIKEAVNEVLVSLGLPPRRDPGEIAAERLRALSDYEDLLKTRFDEDQQQKKLRREREALTREANEVLAAWSKIQDQIHHLDSKLARNVPASRTLERELKARVYATFPPQDEAKVRIACERVQEIADAARKASWEKNTDETFAYDELDLGRRTLRSCRSYKPLVRQLLHDAVPAALAALDRLRFSTMTGAELDEAIASIISDIPQLRQIPCVVDPQSGELVAA